MQLPLLHGLRCFSSLTAEFLEGGPVFRQRSALARGAPGIWQVLVSCFPDERKVGRTTLLRQTPSDSLQVRNRRPRTFTRGGHSPGEGLRKVPGCWVTFLNAYRLDFFQSFKNLFDKRHLSFECSTFGEIIGKSLTALKERAGARRSQKAKEPLDGCSAHHLGIYMKNSYVDHLTSLGKFVPWGWGSDCFVHRVS